MLFDHATAYAIAGALYVFIPAIVWALLLNHPEPTVKWWCGGGVLIGSGTLWLILTKNQLPEWMVSGVSALMIFLGIALKINAVQLFLKNKSSLSVWVWGSVVYVSLGTYLFLFHGQLFRNIFYLTCQILQYAYLAYLCWLLHCVKKWRVILWVFYSYIIVVFLLFLLPFADYFGQREVWQLGWTSGLLVITGIIIVFTNNVAYMGVVLEAISASKIKQAANSTSAKKESIFVSYFWNAERERVLANVSRKLIHEINQSLTGLNATAALMRRAVSDQKITQIDIGKAVKRLDDNLRQIDFIIRQIQPLAKSREILFKEVDIIDLILKSIELTGVKAHQFKIVENDIDNYLVDGGEFELMQVFVNLLQNSMQACMSIEVEAFLIIAIHRSENYLHINLSDNGPGFSSSAIEKAGLEIFTTKMQGMGLGLWISCDIIERHHGKLFFKNIKHGANVEVMLPYKPADEDV